MAWFRQLFAENIGMEVEEDAGKKMGENNGMAEEGAVEEDVLISSSLGFRIWFAFNLVTTIFALVRLHFCVYSHVASELVVFLICIEAN